MPRPTFYCNGVLMTDFYAIVAKKTTGVMDYYNTRFVSSPRGFSTSYLKYLEACHEMFAQIYEEYAPSTIWFYLD